MIDRYVTRHVKSPTRRKSAQQTMLWHLGVLRRAAYDEVAKHLIEPLAISGFEGDRLSPLLRQQRISTWGKEQGAHERNIGRGGRTHA